MILTQVKGTSLLIWLCCWAAIYYRLAEGLTIDPPEDEIVFPAGVKFTLKCQHDSPVEWSYLSSEYEDPEHKIIDSEGLWSTLTVMNATYLDTGSYSCSPESDPSTTKSIYVYIRDVNHLLVADNQHEIITFFNSDDVVIPCKPSFPEVNVTLHPMGSSEMVLLGYDNKHGFTVRLQKSAQLECLGTFMSYSSNVIYELESEISSSDLETPEIEIVDRSVKDHILVGHNVTLRCTETSPPGAHLDLYWMKPVAHTHPGKFIEETSVRRNYRNGKPMNVHLAMLNIVNIQKSEEGVYKCKVQNNAGAESFQLINLKVFDDTNKFLNVSFNGSSTITSRPGKPEVVLIANIAAHPSPGITWIGPSGRTIGMDKKYNISVTMDSTRLIISRPLTTDSGEYIMKAQNAAGIKMLTYNLNVEGEPSVSLLDVPGALLQNSTYNITCQVVGYPVPSVEMTFKTCPNPNDCGSSSPTRIKIRKVFPDCTVSCNYTAKLPISTRGLLTCAATNRLGTVHDSKDIRVTEVPNEFHVHNSSIGLGTISDLDPIVLICGASKFSFTGDIIWQFQKPGSTTASPINEKEGARIERNESETTYWVTLTIPQPKVIQSGKYICRAKKLNNFFAYLTTTITVETSYMPHFIGASNNSDIILSLGAQTTWICNVSGVPKPQIVWFKDGKKITSGSRYNIGFFNKSLTVSYLDENDEGSYACLASNKKGSSRLLFNLRIKKRSVFEWMAGAVAIILITVFLIGMMWQRDKIKKEKKQREMEFVGDLEFFKNGQAEAIDPNLDIGEQADFLPYNPAWEFPRDKLKLGKQLGHGAFGVVMKAEAYGLRNSEDKTVVAVKMVKKHSDVTLIKALASELKIMSHLGQHVNVVNLLGACTKNLANRELLVMVEYCKYGNIHDFLLTHRDSFINQVNPANGHIEASENSMGFPIGDYMSNSNYKGGSDDYNPVTSNHTITTNVSMSTPVGEDGYLMTKEASQHYHGDYNPSQSRKLIRTQDLLCWGFQVAKGMEYLASRKVLHGDLAARNVLLAEDNVVKICDFGLAKSMYKTDVYTKSGNALLPIKWMSIEAIEDRVFSTQSDVWAYGILLWEFFTLSRTPYPGVVPKEVLTLLKSGYRMQKPEYATEDVYNLMSECWDKSPMLRPSFTECAERLGSMLEESVKQHYMDLNNPYMEFNALHSNVQDYLSVLNPPTYVNCTSPAMNEENFAGNDYTPMQHDQSYKLPLGSGKNRRVDGEEDAVELGPMLPQPGETKIFNPGYEGLGHMVHCTN